MRGGPETMQRVAVCFVAFSVLALLVVGGAGAQETTDQFDCEDFQYQEDAQAVYDQDPSDPNGLDGPVGEAFDGVEGIACEELPHRPGSGQPPGDQISPGQREYGEDEVIRNTIPKKGKLAGTGGATWIVPAGLLLLSTGLLLGCSGIRRGALLRSRTLPS
jgi:hypothetical protein